MGYSYTVEEAVLEVHLNIVDSITLGPHKVYFIKRKRSARLALCTLQCYVHTPHSWGYDPRNSLDIIFILFYTILISTTKR